MNFKVTFCFLVAIVFSINEPKAQVFEKKITCDNGNVSISRLSKLSNGNIGFIGLHYYYNDTCCSEAIFGAMNSNGDLIFAKKGSFINAAGSRLSGIVATDDGGFIACGLAKKDSSFTAPCSSIFMRIDSSGNVIWIKRMYNTLNNNSSANATELIRLSDNNFLVQSTWINHPSGGVNYTKINENGNVLWQRSYNQHSTRISPNHDGGFVTSGGWFSIFLFDSTGNQTMGKYINPGFFTDYWVNAYTTIKTNDQGYVILGDFYSLANQDDDLAVCRFDSSLNMLWFKKYTRPNTIFNFGYLSIKEHNTGGFIIASEAIDSLGSSALYFNVDNAGNILNAYHQVNDSGDYSRISDLITANSEGDFFACGDKSIFNSNYYFDSHGFITSFTKDSAAKCFENILINDTNYYPPYQTWDRDEIEDSSLIVISGFLETGTISISNGCIPEVVDTSETETPDVTTPIPPFFFPTLISKYEIHLFVSEDANYTLTIYNMLGQLVANRLLIRGDNFINMRPVANGLYVYEIKNNSEVLKGKFVLKN